MLCLTGAFRLIKGKVIGHRDGYGFLRVDGKEDYYLSQDEMKRAMHGDVILAQPYGQDRKGVQKFGLFVC